MDELREKVILGLEHCSNRTTCDEDCPYWYIMNDPDMGIDECTSQLANDALSLLKAQEPKVMTLEEVEEAGGLIYYECKGEYGATPAYVYKVGENSFDIMTIGNDGFQEEKSFDYKTGWRCWTANPTDKQREAAPWGS